MPFANNQGVRIHYETIGSGGHALVLHHATFGSGADFADLGYVDTLKDDRQLIVLDARGHGESDKPHDPTAYELALRTLDVLTVLDDLSIHRSDYFGYSLGGWIGYGLAKRAPNRFNSFILGGAHPYAENMRYFRNLMPRDPSKFAAVMDQLFGGRLPPEMLSRFLANDPDALQALTQDREPNADVLPPMTMPCLLFVGELDPRLAKVTECASELPNATLFTLPECDTLVRYFVAI
jgi:pimeloyl-ACP methyl ester carboxylesterase